MCVSERNPWKSVKVKSTGRANRKLSGWMKSYRRLWEPALVPVKTDNTLRRREERQLEWTAVWRSVCGCCALTFPNTRLSDDIMEHKYDQRLQRQHCEHFNHPNFEVHKFSSCLSSFLFALIQRICARSNVTNSACLIVLLITNLRGRPPASHYTHKESA